jgi:hypothetical protein
MLTLLYLHLAKRCHCRYSSPTRDSIDEVTFIDAIHADIKSLTVSEQTVAKLTPAFKKYNEEQLATVKLPGSSQPVRI